MNRTDDPGEVDAAALDRMTTEARHALHAEARASGGDFPRLQGLDFAGLQQLAAGEGLETLPGLSRQELLFEILKHRCARSGLCWAEGALEVLPDGFGFLRSSQHDFEPGPDDIYVSPSQIRRLNLKPGHWVGGPVRPPGRGEKYLALLHVETVNGASIADLRRRIPFDQRTPVLPQRRLRLAAGGGAPGLRLIGLLSPWGFGQRILLQAPPGSGRTLLLTQITGALLQANPELQAVLCLLDERPEDVTEMRRAIGRGPQCEVVASTFDQPPGRHVALAEMALARAQRMVESGRDVLLVVDSLTALARAYHQELPHSGKILAAGLDAGALHRTKRLFAAGRNLEEGGSLTIVASVLTDTGSRVDAVIAEEFTGKGNAEVVLDRELAAQHVFPAIDVMRTGTRREDSLLPPPAVAALRRLRQELGALSARERLQRLEQLLAQHADETGLFALLAQGAT